MCSCSPCRLTAFVLRSFAQARPFIFVDPGELETIQNWITKKQLPNGCIPKYGRLFNKRMKVSKQRLLFLPPAPSVQMSGQ